MPHRPPEAHRHWQIDDGVADARVRPFVGLVESALGGGLVGPGPRQTELPVQELLHDRRPCRARSPGQQLALGVETGLIARDARRAVEIVGLVLLAGPAGLHRLARQRAGDGCGLGDEVHVEPAAEAAAQQRDMQLDLLSVQPQGLGRCPARQARHLRRRPDAGVALVEQHGAVLWLQRCMGQQRRVVLGADGSRGLLDRRWRVAH